MMTVNGIYENGVVQLERLIQTQKSINAIVTFLDDETYDDSKRLTLKDFSFLKARNKSKRFKGSFSDVVVEDRNAEL
ncbi:MAG: hypothetical protein RO257_05830 [Candidatus Kapabacteria bacterium]|jgi:hypothetical protein|nr:hypothetical protein [Candidatus Kapabacteria bacterium]